jgi:hypothetical protein
MPASIRESAAFATVVQRAHVAVGGIEMSRIALDICAAGRSHHAAGYAEAA